MRATTLMKSIVAGVLVVLAAAARADQIDATFFVPTGNWNTAANWDIAAVPNNGGGNTFSCFLGASDVTANIDVTIDNLSIAAMGRLSMPNGRTLVIVSDAQAGSINNAGAIALNAAGAVSQLRARGGVVTLTGGGTITMGNNALNRIIADNGGSLVNVNNTIQGSGALGLNTMNITNQGLIVANQTVAMTVDPMDTLTNTGTLRARNGATLMLGPGSYANTGGIIEALDGSVVQMSTVVITGGTLQTSAGGDIRTSSSERLIDVTSAGMLTVQNGDSVSCSGTLTNSGQIRLNSAGAVTSLISDGGPLTLAGGGTISLSNSTINRLSGTNGGGLINLNNTIIGSGNIGSNTQDVTNLALIVANQSADLVVDPLVTCTNAGVLRAMSGATLVLQAGRYANAGGVIEALEDSLVELSSATIEAGTLRTVGTGRIHTTGVETLDSGGTPLVVAGTVRIQNGDVLDLIGTLTNNGVIELAASTAVANLRAIGGTATLSGGGTISMTNSVLNRLTGAGDSNWVNVDNTIQGAGNIGLATTDFDNRSLIVANLPAGIVLNALNVFRNTGTLRAAAGAVLSLNLGEFNNEGGVIEAENASVVELATARIVGGTLRTSGTGFVRTTAVETFDGLDGPMTTEADVRVQNGDELALFGTIINDGAISVNSAGATTQIDVNGTVLLQGGGTISMGNSTLNRIMGSSTGMLMNIGNTIRGSGNVGVNLLGIVNAGTIMADQTVAMTIDVNTSGFDNLGALVVSGGGSLTIAAGPFSTSGTVTVNAGSVLSRIGDFAQTAGTTLVNGTLSATGIVNIQGGVLGGGGAISSAVTNAGTVAPGNSTGRLTLGSGYTQSASGALMIEIAGLSPATQHDQLVVAGTAQLNGLLSVAFAPEYTPQIGDSFTIMTFASRMGSFADLSATCISGGTQASIAITNTAVIVSIVASRPDINCNCAFDADDITAFVIALTNPDAFAGLYPGCPIDVADLNNDDLIDAHDVQAFVDAVQ